MAEYVKLKDTINEAMELSQRADGHPLGAAAGAA